MLEIVRGTEVIWGLDWKKHFPVHFQNYSIEISSIDEFLSLKKRPDSFLVTSDSTTDTFVKDIDSKAKEAFLTLNSDFFIFKKGDEVAGFIIGEMRDWSSYYIRFMNISPLHRKNNLTVLFCQKIEEILHVHGVDKVLIDVAPTNVKQILRMSQMGYVSTGNVLSERFGAYLQLTKFLRDDVWEAFSKSFTISFYSNASTGEAMRLSSNK